jgi:hypothetical protein
VTPVSLSRAFRADEPNLFVSIAALVGYHLFGLRAGGAFETMGADAFIEALGELMVRTDAEIACGKDLSLPSLSTPT